MAQDPPRTYDQGYPHDGAGQQPDGGYDQQQQAWYPQQAEQPADPWGTAAQQGWQPQQHPQQHPQQTGGWDGTAWSGTSWDATQTAAATAQGHDPQGYYQGGYGQDGYGQGAQQPGATSYPGASYTDPYAAAYADPTVPYGTPEPPSYAPAGAGQDQGEYQPYQPYQPQAEQPGQPGQPGQGAPDAFDAYGSAEPSAYAQPQGAYGAVDGADDGSGAAYAGEPDTEPGRGSGGRPSLADRARSAATAVVSPEHGPSRRTLLIRTGAGVAALAVLATVAVLAMSGDDSGTAGASAGADAEAAQSYTVAHAKAWVAKPVQAASNTDDTLSGSWVTSDAVVRADGAGVQAYALADGKPTWRVTAPAEGAPPCGLSQTVGTAGIGAVLFHSGTDVKSPCTVVAAVDVKTGRTTWTKSLSDTKDGYDARVFVLGDKVVAVGEDKVSAWAAADGKDLWQYGGQGKFCSLSGGAAGATVVLHSSCADSTPADQAVALNAADGKVTWWRGLNNKPKTVRVLSAEPAVVVTSGETPADDRIFAWGASGDPAVEIPVTGAAGRLDTARGTFDVAPTVFFHEKTMLTTVGPADGGNATAVTAYDLATGKPLWTTAIAEKRKARAVGVEGDSGLLLAVDERLDQPAHISRFALKGGQETQGGAFPRGTGSLLTSGRVLSGGGKLVVLPEHSANFGTATAFQAKD